MKFGPNHRMAAIAGAVILFDQLTKYLVLRTLHFGYEEKIILPGFFKFVHWGNTGAAWSMFHGNNELLAIISLVALLLLFIFRSHFDTRTAVGQTALALVFGGIVGNLIDRLVHKHVIDFIYFYVIKRNGYEAGFPAFNLADSAICSGVGLLFFLSWRDERQSAAPLAKENV